MWKACGYLPNACAHLHVIVGAEALAFGFFGDGQELGAAARSPAIHAFKA